MATYPNFAGKHVHDSFVTPEANVAYARRVGLLDGFEPPEAVILTYQRSLLQHVEKGPRGYRGVVMLPSTDHRVGVLGGFGFGAPMAALLLEDFVALGTRRFLSLGTAGSLQPACALGDVVVCERAIRDEGVSHHYLPPATYAEASPALTDHLAAELDDRGVTYTRGAAWTIDTPYRETVEEARHYQAEGVLCVEMEAAALFSVAAYRGVEVASAFVISDSLHEAAWEPQMHSEGTAEGLRRLYDAGLAALLRPVSGPA